jgi:hypothetical protein
VDCDWASRSLQREFEEVIMVEVLIEEMFSLVNSPELNFNLPPTNFRGPALLDGNWNSPERRKRCTDLRKSVFGKSSALNVQETDGI